MAEDRARTSRLATHGAQLPGHVAPGKASPHAARPGLTRRPFASASRQAQTRSVWLAYDEEPLGSARELCWRSYARSPERWPGTGTAKPPSAALAHRCDPRRRFCEPHLQRADQPAAP